MMDLDFKKWRRLAREGIVSGFAPERMNWSDELQLFSSVDVVAADTASFTCPKEFVGLAQNVACHRSPEKWDLLYRILWEIVYGNRRLLEDAADPRIYRAQTLAKQVRRDMHKMTAFVRFEKVNQDPEAFVAWHEPDHLILRATAPFFRRRFGAMNWAILMPEGAAVWDQKTLTFFDGPLCKPQTQGDALSELWRTYFSSIFNPARLKIKMMKREMPVRYWKNLPEAELIPDMIAGASGLVQEMIRASQESVLGCTIVDRTPSSSFEDLRARIKSCTACELCESGRPAEAGAGSANAHLMIVGEQAGDNEDEQAVPFSGPAGQVLREIFRELGIDENRVYLTNAVKHFRFVVRSNERLQLKPQVSHIKACRPWLREEMQMLGPRTVLCLGATAAFSVLGYALPVAKARGRRDLMSEPGARVCVSFHPATILRSQEAMAAEMRAQLKSDIAEAYSDSLEASPDRVPSPYCSEPLHIKMRHTNKT